MLLRKLTSLNFINKPTNGSPMMNHAVSNMQSRMDGQKNETNDQLTCRLDTHPAFGFLSEFLTIKDLQSNAIVESPIVDLEYQQVVAAAMELSLQRSVRRHCVLVGESGSGRSTVLEILNRRLHRTAYPCHQFVNRLYIDTNWIGPEESRGCFESIVQILRMTKNQVYLYIDGLHSLIRRTNGGSNITLLQALLERPNVSLVGTLTANDFRDTIGNDCRLLKRLERVQLPPIDLNSLKLVVASHARQLTTRLGIGIDNESITKTISLTTQYLLSEHQPQKSISILTQAAEDKTLMSPIGGQTQPDLNKNDIVRVMSLRTSLPKRLFDSETVHEDYQKSISDTIVGQDKAVQQVSQELQLIASGFSVPGKPASVMMFAGTTGTGKTELAKRIASLYSSTGLLRVYPMGNYTESHSVSGIVGVPPGYVGHENGGELVSDLLADPYGVFLLDEAEKCHPNVWKPFLTLFDEGWIIDQKGRKAFADRAIFILTTNAGDRSISQLTRSGKSQEEISQIVRKTLSRVRQERSSQPVFPPQFLSRMHRIIVFNPLDLDAMIGISERTALKIQEQWKTARNLDLLIGDAVIRSIASQGHSTNEQLHGEEGGRIIRKLYRDQVEHLVFKTCMLNGARVKDAKRIRVDLVSESDSVPFLVFVEE